MMGKRIVSAILVLAVALSGGLLFLSGCSPGEILDISPPSGQQLAGEIYIGGSVAVPGIYPVKDGDTLETIIQAAGGATENADLSRLSLQVSVTGEGEAAQKIDINLAEAWLLEALPGIGPARAQAIVDYRSQNGPFRQILEIINVDGIGMATYNDQGPLAIKGTLFQEPEVREKTGHLYFAATEIKLDGQWREIEGQALLFVPRFSDYSYGDVLLVTGEPETPPRFDSFDYQGYLANQGIHTTMLYPQIEVLDTGQGFAPLEWIYSLRGQMADSLAEAMPEPQASLAQGITLGIRDNIPSSVRQDFAYSGTAHLLAISGLHLGIVAGILLSLGLWLFGRRHYIYIWLALGIVWLYVVLTGMQPPVVRAAIMASLFLTAELLGRQRNSITALAFAAAIMVGFNPQILWSASFQMSFMAMAGLIFVFPRLRDRGRRFVEARLGDKARIAPAAGFLSDSLSVTLAAIIGVWPLVAYYFGTVSMVGALATLLALPALPLIIVLSALAGLLGIFALPLAQVIGGLAWPFLSYLLLVAGGFAALPLAWWRWPISMSAWSGCTMRRWP
jgi:competence protein ComEC